jgi:hypothetical protein
MAPILLQEASSTSEQSSLQQRLHIPTAICYKQDVDIRAADGIDHSIRFEIDLPILAHAQGLQLFGAGTPFWGFAQALYGGANFTQDIIRRIG